MTTIIRSMMLKPTARGIEATKSPEFILRCRQIAASAKVQGLRFEVLEGRLQYYAATTLCLRLAHLSEDDYIFFMRAHLAVIDKAIRNAIAGFINRLDVDPAAALAELGAKLPARAEGIATEGMLDRGPGGEEMPKNWKEGDDFIAVLK